MPDWKRAIGKHLEPLNLEPTREAEIVEEMAQHLEDRYQELLAAGTDEQTAEREALSELEDHAALRELRGRLRRPPEQPPGAPHQGRLIADLWWDVRYGLRTLRKSPGFAAAAVLTLALGIGANTAIFSVVNAVLLKPLPYPEPARLVALRGGQSLPDVTDIAGQARTFSAMGATAEWPLDLIGQDEPQRIDGGLVGGEVFAALGVQPLLGRTFSEADDRGRAPVVVASYDFWRKHLGADRGAIGRPLQLSGVAYTLIGVMPPQFRMPVGKSALWVPFRVGYPEAVNARGAHFMSAVARLREGGTLGQAQSELDAIGKHLAELYPAEARTFRVMPLRDQVVGQVRTPLLVLLGAVGLVLLIACSNFATLLLARTVARRQEMQVRSALGASRWRLLRQLITESALLALIGGAAGVLLALAGVRLLVQLKPAELPSFYRLSIDLNTLLFALGISLVTGVLFGSAPALQFWGLGEVHLAGGRAIGGRSLLRRALVTVELALALVLLMGAGLLIRSFWRLQSAPTGLDPQGVLTVRFSLPASRYGPIERQEAFLTRLDESLRQTPGVQAAGLVTELPLSGMRMMHNMIIEGQPPVPEGQEPEIYAHEVSPDYFAAIGTPLLMGRAFSEQDTPNSPLVALANQSFVRRFFPGRSPLGARVTWARSDHRVWMTIVGVAADVRFESLEEEQEPTVYTPYTQKQQPWKRFCAVVIRSRAQDPMLLADVARKKIWELDAQLPITDVEPLAAVMQESLNERRFNMILLAGFAGLAYLLAAVGIYGVVAHLVAQRVREVGVRMALGAQHRDILWLMLGQGVPLIGLGVLLGASGALLATRVLRSLLYGTSTNDPATFAAVIGVLVTVALLATYIPARRAARVDPMVALRYE